MKNTTRLFPYDRWTPQLPKVSRVYQSAEPFPHFVFENFLEEPDCRRAMEEFPKPHETSWTHYKHYNEKKIGKSNRRDFPPFIGLLTDELNSPDFLEFLSKLTGIPGLMADPLLEGGGLHQSGPGGFLNMHADFTMHHYHKNWRRRVNLILYLNEGWKEEWNGKLEFWEKDMKRCAVKIAPELNRAVVFNTDETSFHGFPDRLRCTPGVARKSLALYYYTPQDDPRAPARSTNYRARPGDGWKGAFIWLDKKILHFYSVLKKKFGLSDEIASKILRWLSGGGR
jgi:hypothetical protein